MATPSAMAYANRGNAFLKMKKPLAAIRDADEALKVNPDSAKAFKVRGKANALLGRWKEAAKDLGDAQRIDYDEDTYEVQKKVTEKVAVGAKKEAARKEKAAAKEKKRQEKLRRQREREATQAAAETGDGSGFPGMGGGFPGMGGMGGGMPGMPGGFPGMGGGGMPGMPAGMDFSKIMSDPEIMAAMQNPKMMQVFMEMQTQGPMAIMKYQNDPEVMNLIMKIQGAMGGGGAGMGAMGGMGGGMP